MTEGPTLRTSRLVLRRLHEADREPLARINADPRVAEFLPGALTRAQSDEMFDRIEAHFEVHGFCFWAVDVVDGPVCIGLAGLAVPRFEAHFMPAVEIGWRFSPEYWGRGYATEAARAALRFGFEEAGLREIVAFTVPANTRSRRVMERIGMSHDAADDFDHPSLPTGHPLQRHLLYRISREAWVAHAAAAAGE